MYFNIKLKIIKFLLFISSTTFVCIRFFCNSFKIQSTFIKSSFYNLCFLGVDETWWIYQAKRVYCIAMINKGARNWPIIQILNAPYCMSIFDCRCVKQCYSWNRNIETTTIQSSLCTGRKNSSASENWNTPNINNTLFVLFAIYELFSVAIALAK